MKKLLASVLMLVLFVSVLASCGNAKTDWEYLEGKKELIIGYTLFEPMNYQDDDGNLIGFDTEFAKAVCEELGLEPKFVVINWDIKEVDLNAKSIDCIWNGFTVDDDRKEQVDFSISYVTNKQVIVIKKDNEEKFKTAEDMKDAKTTAEKKSAGENAVLEHDILKDSKYTAAEKQTDVLMEVKSGTSDVGVIDYIMAKAMLAEGTDYGDLMMVESIELAPEEYAIGFRKGSPVTLEKVNAAINKLADSGKLAEIAERYDLLEQLTDSLKK